jgi:hypothetical protein
VANRRRRAQVTSTQADAGTGGGLLEELHRDPLSSAPAAGPARRAEPVPAPQRQEERTITRMTLDLREEDRRRLDEWAARTGLDIGRPRLGSAAVLRAVIEALTDPERTRPEVVDAVTEALADRERRSLNTGP